MRIHIAWHGIPLEVEGDLEDGYREEGLRDCFLVYEVWHDGHRQICAEALEDFMAEIEMLCMRQLARDAELDSGP